MFSEIAFFFSEASNIYGLITPALILVAFVTRKDLALMCAGGSLMGEWAWAADMDYYSTILAFAMINFSLVLGATAHYWEYRCNLSVSVGQMSAMMLICNFLQAISYNIGGLQYLMMHITGLAGWLLVFLLLKQDGRKEWVDDMASDCRSWFYRHTHSDSNHSGNGGHE